MTVASFEQLCAAFCELAEVPAPPLVEDAEGRVAFHVVLRGTTVNLLHCAQVSVDHVFLFFDLGPVNESAKELQALLEANFSALQVHPPIVSLNPQTGHAVLQYVYSFFEATASELYELIDQGAEWATHWRDDLAAAEPCSVRQASPLQPSAMLHQFA